jgi:hypothetical protein
MLLRKALMTVSLIAALSAPALAQVKLESKMLESKNTKTEEGAGHGIRFRFVESRQSERLASGNDAAAQQGVAPANHNHDLRQRQ